MAASNKKMITSCEQKNDKEKKINSNYLDENNGVSSIKDIIKSVSLEMLEYNPPPKRECPMCMLPMPHASGVCGVDSSFYACCGKVVCSGCFVAINEEIRKGNMKRCCPYCRVPKEHSDNEKVKRLKKRLKVNDAEAFLFFGCRYRDGVMPGFTQSWSKAVEFWSKAAELGSIDAYYDLGRAYQQGQGVEQDIKKAIRHYRIAVIGGHEKGSSSSFTFYRNNRLL